VFHIARADSTATDDRKGSQYKLRFLPGFSRFCVNGSGRIEITDRFIYLRMRSFIIVHIAGFLLFVSAKPISQLARQTDPCSLVGTSCTGSASQCCTSSNNSILCVNGIQTFQMCSGTCHQHDELALCIIGPCETPEFDVC
jgi:hypothetical protein